MYAVCTPYIYSPVVIACGIFALACNVLEAFIDAKYPIQREIKKTCREIVATLSRTATEIVEADLCEKGMYA